ncbi:Glutathione S-transferase [Gaiella occulta]|uniref:Glutathione S-transferase n=2 Tax=Gaiella occulta TaxID=1002870 RepID=A0A7M2YWD4_9ACTN|nr:Glutathione S-transferase [Gaiella occulta]
MLRLFQTEWCPSSHRVRQRLTELDVAYTALQVPVERDERTALFQATGGVTIPALVAEDGAVLIGEDAILDYLDRRFDEPGGAVAHREKAEQARRRLLEEAA